MYKCQINVYLILIQSGNILMLRRANTGFKDGMYSLPAGKLDQGETIPQAIVREAKEEVGIDISLSPNWMQSTNILHRYSKDGTVALDFFQSASEFSGTARNIEPEKCDEVLWVSLDAIPENTIPYIKQGIHNAIHGIILDEFIWE